MIIKPLMSALLILCALCHVAAQDKVTWGDHFKINPDHASLAIVHADNSGIYLFESRAALRSAISLLTAATRKSGTLIKLSSTLSEQYRSDFDKALKGKEYECLRFIKDRLYLFALSYDKDAMNLLATEIDKATGSLKGDWKQIRSWDLAGNAKKLDYRIDYNGDSSKIVIASTFVDQERSRYEIALLDSDLRAIGKPVTISNEFDPKDFQVEDIAQTASGNTVLIGRMYEYVEGSKKKDKYCVFKNYNIRLYDAKGKKISELGADTDGNYLVTVKLLQRKDQLTLVAFYSKDVKREHVDGLVVERLDPVAGAVLSSTKMDLDNLPVSEVDNDNRGDDQRNNKESDGHSAPTASLLFRDVYSTPDNGLVILAEQHIRTIRSESVHSGTAGTMSFSAVNVSYNQFDCGNIYMAKLTAAGAIEWLHVLPRSQRERSAKEPSYYAPVPGMPYNYFERAKNRPDFSGLGSAADSKAVHIFFNDREENADVLQPGKPIKMMENYEKTTCYDVTLDMITGKYIRNALFSNRDIPNTMIVPGISADKSLYFVGVKFSTMGRTKVAVGKIACNE